jgi:hypothetical protein
MGRLFLKRGGQRRRGSEAAWGSSPALHEGIISHPRYKDVFAGMIQLDPKNFELIGDLDQ